MHTVHCTPGIDAIEFMALMSWNSKYERDRVSEYFRTYWPTELLSIYSTRSWPSVAQWRQDLQADRKSLLHLVGRLPGRVSDLIIVTCTQSICKYEVPSDSNWWVLEWDLAFWSGILTVSLLAEKGFSSGFFKFLDEYHGAEDKVQLCISVCISACGALPANFPWLLKKPELIR